MVYENLQKDILHGRVFPKERLLERELTERFGVSKTPIREALNRLRQDGLVQGNLYQGMYVIGLSPKDVLEIYEIREHLEGLAAKKVAERVTPEIAKKLRSFLKVANECVRKNLPEYYRLNLEFHNLLKDSCGNQKLCDLLQRLYYPHRSLLSASLLPQRGPEISLDEHKKIVAAILDQNPKLAEKMAKAHIRNAYEGLVDWYKKTQVWPVDEGRSVQ